MTKFDTIYSKVLFDPDISKISMFEIDKSEYPKLLIWKIAKSIKQKKLKETVLADQYIMTVVRNMHMLWYMRDNFK